MQPPPLPLVPFLLSTVFLAEAGSGGGGFDIWKLIERWGIAAIMGIIAWILWKRSETRDREERKEKAEAEAKERARIEKLENERLDIQKQLLEEHRNNSANMQALVVADMQSRVELKAALEGLTDRIESLPVCPKQGT